MGIRSGKIWQPGSAGMVQSVFLEPDGSSVPVGGDICVATSGKPAYMITTLDAASAATRTIMAIALQGRYIGEDILNNAGYRAATGTQRGRIHIGQNRARVPNTTAATRPFMPMLPGFKWVMDKVTGTTIAVGTSYGVTRVAAGNYELGVDGTGHDDAVVKVVGIYEPDYLANGSSFTKYWVQAVLPGGSL